MKNLILKFRIWMLRREVIALAEQLENYKEIVKQIEFDLIIESFKLAKLKQEANQPKAAQKPVARKGVAYL